MELEPAVLLDVAGKSVAPAVRLAEATVAPAPVGDVANAAAAVEDQAGATVASPVLARPVLEAVVPAAVGETVAPAAADAAGPAAAALPAPTGPDPTTAGPRP